MNQETVLVKLVGVAEVPLPRRNARPRFLAHVVFALLAAADEDGVVLDARRTVAEWVNGSDRYPVRTAARQQRQADLLPELKRMANAMRKKATTSDGYFDEFLYFLMGGFGIERRIYQESLPPVMANVSRCLTVLVQQKLVTRWYQHPESGETSDRRFRGAVVCVRLSEQLLELRKSPGP